MTAEELIERLKELPPKTRILTNGYEGGYRDVEHEPFSVLVFAEKVNTEWYYGPHEEVTNYRPHDGRKRFDGVVL